MSRVAKICSTLQLHFVLSSRWKHWKLSKNGWHGERRYITYLVILSTFSLFFFFSEYTASKCDCQVAASHDGSSKNRARRAQINQWPIQRMGQMISELVASFAERREPSLADFDYLSWIAGHVLCYNSWLACSWWPQPPIGSVYWPSSKSVAGPL